MSGVAPLPPGTVLAGRYEIQSVLGRGGFSIAYIANDLTQQDECVVKELAPTGAQRLDQSMDLSAVPSTNPPRLRKRFLDEANTLAKLETPGILHLRDAFEERGTAYYVTDMLPSARTLASILAQEGRLSSEQGQEILFQLLDILEGIHASRILHRDIKPSNILVSPKGEVFLIDFGAAREWHADSAALQTVLFTPGYAPLEQLSDRGRRGPATDIYAVCATAYHMFAGYPPRPSAERADGTEIIPLSKIRPDLDQPLLHAIMAGLRLRFKDRPQSVHELRSMLLIPDPDEAHLSTVEALDAAAQRLHRFNYKKNECPVCSGILERPKPLKVDVCPVCREGTIRHRHFVQRLCACCRTGVLHHRGGKTPILFCPSCRKGPLSFHRRGLLLNKWFAECPVCQAELEGDNEAATLLTSGESKPWDEWLAISGRSAEAWVCDTCGCQYDVLESGRWRQLLSNGNANSVPLPPGSFLTDLPRGGGRLDSGSLAEEASPSSTGMGAGGEGVHGSRTEERRKAREDGQAKEPGASEYFPDEWARIAAGLGPDAGNAECNKCGAEFWLDEESLTLLQFHDDPYKFGGRYLDRKLDIADVPWFGAGKTSGNRGLVCPQCDTELDDDGEFLNLVHSPSVRLMRYQGRSLAIVDWHRIAQGLPLCGEEGELYADLDEALRNGFVSGEIPFDSRNPDLLWSGHARELEWEEHEWVELGEGTLTITRKEIVFGKLLRKWRVPLSGVLSFRAEEDRIYLNVSGESNERVFDLTPAELVVHLNSGDRVLAVTAELVAAVLSRGEERGLRIEDWEFRVED